MDGRRDVGRSGLSVLIALGLVLCCIGLPLLAAGAVSVGLAAALGGAAAAGVALAVVIVLVVARIRHRRSAGPST